jgi:hypothetical protein
MVDYTGFSKEEALIALYNRARPQGMGVFQYVPGSMSLDLAKKLLKDSTYFDYIYGRVLKVDLRNDGYFDERLYDRDNGFGAAQYAIDELLK